MSSKTLLEEYSYYSYLVDKINNEIETSQDSIAKCKENLTEIADEKQHHQKGTLLTGLLLGCVGLPLTVVLSIFSALGVGLLVLLPFLGIFGVEAISLIYDNHKFKQNNELIKKEEANISRKNEEIVDYINSKAKCKNKIYEYIDNKKEKNNSTLTKNEVKSAQEKIVEYQL